MTPLNLTLVPVAEDPDLSALRRVLAAHGLHQSGESVLLSDAAGQLPVVGGATLHFDASWLGAGARSFYGQIFQSFPNQALCRLIFDLATAGRLVLVPDFGPPHLIVCGRTHEPAAVHNEWAPPWLEEICFVDTPAALHRVLHGDWESFRSTFLDDSLIWGPREDWPTGD